jgi:hypothetical protein
MTVTVYYKDGSSEAFSHVSSYSVVGDVVTITGTDAGGVAGTYTLHWSDIKKIVQS